jgi:uncharacterized protein (DUF433 family)
MGRGKRMMVSAIFREPGGGANVDDIMGGFDGLDREQIEAVTEFAVA